MKVLILTFSMLICCCCAVSANPLPSERGAKRSADGVKSCNRHEAHHVLSREAKEGVKGEKEERKRGGDPDDIMEMFRSFSKKDMDKARDIFKNFRRVVDMAEDMVSKDDGTMMNYASKAIRALEHIHGMRSIPGLDNFFNMFTSGGAGGEEDGGDIRKKDPMENVGNFFSNMINKFKPAN